MSEANDWGTVADGSKVVGAGASTGVENASTVKVDKRSKEYKESLKSDKADNNAGIEIAKTKSEKRYDIIIAQSNNSLDSKVVKVGVNGYMYEMHRGKRISVPWEVVNILMNEAGETIVEKEDGVEVKRFVPSVSISLFGETQQSV